MTSGKCGPAVGGDVLLGEDDNPFPNQLMETMKWRLGSIARPAPINPSLRVWVPVKKVGRRMTLSLVGLNSP